ncbi:MAG: alcohol dehydrogenase catalytic domain-containing protein [Candidatus Eisenbacteria bacterium]|nr:alcohol dehydrogenase catalytic domain-containing protein [Candidatus Eisenbacteria bacterium]
MPALLYDGKTAGLRPVPVPDPQPGEALLDIVLAGVCATDIEITRGYMGFTGILGHEFVGRVAGLNPGASGAPAFSPGERVVGEINLACRTCPICRRGLTNHCPHRRVLGIQDKDGVFAPHATLPLENLHRVPEGVDDERAVFTEPLAAALEIPEQVSVEPASQVLVVGDGRLGLLVTMVLARVSRQVTLLGRHEERAGIVEELGVRWVAAADGDGLGRDFDIAVEASGSPEGWNTGLAHLRPRGTLVLKTTTHQSRAWNPAPLVIDEITVVGSRCGPFPRALEWLAEGRVDPRALISRRLPLSAGADALELAGGRGSLKVLLEP